MKERQTEETKIHSIQKLREGEREKEHRGGKRQGQRRRQKDKENWLERRKQRVGDTYGKEDKEKRD